MVMGSGTAHWLGPGRVTGHSEIDPAAGRRSLSGLPTIRPVSGVGREGRTPAPDLLSHHLGENLGT